MSDRIANGVDLGALHDELEQQRTRAECAEAENAELRLAAVTATARAALLETETKTVLRAVRAFAQEPYSPRARRDLLAAIGRWELHTQQSAHPNLSNHRTP